MQSNGLLGGSGDRGLCLGAEKTQSQKSARKCGRIPHVGCTPEDERAIILYERNRGAACLDQLDNQRKYTSKRQARKPNKAMESASSDFRGAPWFPVKLI
jgi:hypothetical protein